MRTPLGDLATQHPPPLFRQLSIGIPGERLLDSMGKQRRTRSKKKEPESKAECGPCYFLSEQEIICCQFVTHSQPVCMWGCNCHIQMWCWEGWKTGVKFGIKLILYFYIENINKLVLFYSALQANCVLIRIECTHIKQKATIDGTLSQLSSLRLIESQGNTNFTFYITLSNEKIHIVFGI